jgi:hypothetical protein
MPLDLMLYVDIALSLAFIVLALWLAIKQHTWHTVPIALCALGFLFQWVLTVLQVPGWVNNLELRSFWTRLFYGLLAFFICLHLYSLLRRY